MVVAMTVWSAPDQAMGDGEVGPVIRSVPWVGVVVDWEKAMSDRRDVIE